MSKRSMMAFVGIREIFSRWIDSVADLITILMSRFAPLRKVRLVENKSGEFVVHTNEGIADSSFTHDRIRIVDGQIDHRSGSAMTSTTLAGSHIELVLQSDRFIFRPLELPTRANEFMPGIVRSQIDRITPWNAADAAFGWSEPVQTDGEKMVVTIVATTLSSIRPYVQAIADIGTQSIAVFTTQPEADSDAGPIKVWEQRGRVAKDVGRIRRALVAVLAIGCITASIAIGTNAFVGMNLTVQQDELARQLSVARSAAGLGSMTAAERSLERRKYERPLTVLVLEALSKILPDQTYVTELRLEGNKVRLTGITRDAPSLIGLMEQSGRFSQATFFAPTTRSPSDPGESFHIEVVVKPFGPST